LSAPYRQFWDVPGPAAAARSGTVAPSADKSRTPVPRSRWVRIEPSADVVMSASLSLSCGRPSGRAFGAPAPPGPPGGGDARAVDL